MHERKFKGYNRALRSYRPESMASCHSVIFNVLITCITLFSMLFGLAFFFCFLFFVAVVFWARLCILENGIVLWKKNNCILNIHSSSNHIRTAPIPSHRKAASAFTVSISSVTGATSSQHKNKQKNAIRINNHITEQLGNVQ